jgi:murein DD-endopeptidase MepM/ murein hydrolase activator NlpD
MAAEAAIEKPSLQKRLLEIRSQSQVMETKALESLQAQKDTQSQLKKLQELRKMDLHARALSLERIRELEQTVGDLERRRSLLREKVLDERARVRTSLAQLLRLSLQVSPVSELSEELRLRPLKQRWLSERLFRSVHEIEAIRADIEDAAQLEDRIGEERQKLEILIAEAEQRQGLLSWNEKVQRELLQARVTHRLQELEEVRRLRHRELELERMLKNFQARMELQDLLETEKSDQRSARLKGRLLLPASGRLISSFGKAKDGKSQLTIFRKGIELEIGLNQDVKAVEKGRVTYCGVLAGYGQVILIDHGDHLYSLIGNLGELRKKTGDEVRLGEVLGQSDDAGTPIYFELRSRNIPVNPLQWVSNSTSL